MEGVEEDETQWSWEELSGWQQGLSEKSFAKPWRHPRSGTEEETGLRDGKVYVGLLSSWAAELLLRGAAEGASEGAAEGAGGAEGAWLLSATWASGQSGREALLSLLRAGVLSRRPLRSRAEDGSWEGSGSVLGHLRRLHRAAALGRAVRRPQWLLLRSQLPAEPLAELGRGSFGAVHLYHCRDAGPGSSVRRPAAVKTAAGAGSQKAFLEECLLSVAANSRWVLGFLGMVGLGMRVGGGLGLAMELSEAGDLRTALEKRPAGPGEAGELRLLVRWALSCARGIAHLAAIRIVHRDVAARNFLLVQREGGLVPLISDFGLARRGAEWRTAEGESISLRWAAPELLSPDSRLSSTASDLWALGVVFWELFHRPLCAPYAELPDGPLLDTLLGERLERGDRLPLPGPMPQPLQALSQELWAQDPRRRPQPLQLVYSLAALLRSL